MTLTIRPARPADAPAMCALLNAIIARGGTTAHRRPFDNDRMLHHYIQNPNGVSITVAENAAGLVGFQSLERATADDKLPEGWGIIATFVRLGEQSRGVGARLFEATQTAAKAGSITAIDATIRKENSGGRRYYTKMGFADYSESDETVSKRFDIA